MWQTALSLGGRAGALGVIAHLDAAPLALQHEAEAVLDVVAWAQREAEIDAAADRAIEAARRRHGW